MSLKQIVCYEGEDYVDDPSTCSKIISPKIDRDWLQSREYCRRKNMSMVEISSTDDIVKVREHVNSSYKDSIWTGISTVEWQDDIGNKNESNVLCVIFSIKTREYELEKCSIIFSEQNNRHIICENGNF